MDMLKRSALAFEKMLNYEYNIVAGSKRKINKNLKYLRKKKLI